MKKVVLLLLVISMTVLPLVSCSQEAPEAVKIVSVEKSDFNDFVDNFTIKYSDGTEFSFQMEKSLASGGGNSGASSEGGESMVKLQLPERFYLVVGDTFELFYTGMLNVLNTDYYDFEFTFSKNENLGNAYKRKYVYTPKAADVGEHKVFITARNNEGEVVDTQSVIFEVNRAPVSPKEEKVILLIGDSSLTNANGEIAKELYRRLVNTGGKPAGYGLTNIKFIGSRQAKSLPEAKHEGYGGYRFADFCVGTTNSIFQYIYGDFSDKSVSVDQHSIYQDEKGVQWKLEDISADKIKIISMTGTRSYVMPQSGKLTWVSGGANKGDIVYNKSQQAEGNPFWSKEKQRNDFVAYAKSQGVDKIDEFIISLGGNGSAEPKADIMRACRNLIDSILADFPNAHITLVTYPLPSRDGLAYDYGTSWKYYEKMSYFFGLYDWYEELKGEDKYKDKIDIVCTAPQFDVENNTAKTNMQVNTRSTTTEKVGSNGLHPLPAGAQQIADAVTRYLVSRYQK